MFPRVKAERLKELLSKGHTTLSADRGTRQYHQIRIDFAGMECIGLSLPWLDFFVNLMRAKAIWKEELQLMNCHQEIAYSQVRKAISWLIIDVCGPSPMGSVPLLGE